ncbi:hypothetical protein VPH35_071852 [Triticum aestivum]
MNIINKLCLYGSSPISRASSVMQDLNLNVEDLGARPSVLAIPGPSFLIMTHWSDGAMRCRPARSASTMSTPPLRIPGLQGQSPARVDVLRCILLSSLRPSIDRLPWFPWITIFN